MWLNFIKNYSSWSGQDRDETEQNWSKQEETGMTLSQKFHPWQDKFQTFVWHQDKTESLGTFSLDTEMRLILLSFTAFLLKQLFMRPSVDITQIGSSYQRAASNVNIRKMRQWPWPYLRSWVTNKELRTISFFQLFKFEIAKCTHFFICDPGAKQLAISSSGAS